MGSATKELIGVEDIEEDIKKICRGLSPKTLYLACLLYDQ
jgi:hypothetical protein